MRTYFKFLIAALIFLISSCSLFNQSEKVVGWDCLPVYECEPVANIIAYTYDSSTNYSKLSGEAFDNLTKEPLIGASILLLPCNKETKTDINGVFSFDFSFDDCDSIKVSYMGYLPGVISIRELIEKFREDSIN
jgi:hypothetical protein